jgi:hypothetical protein
MKQQLTTNRTAAQFAKPVLAHTATRAERC